MTFHGEEIGIPTLGHIEIYVSEKGLFAGADRIYDYWQKKNWLTQKGGRVKTLESACSTYNGIALQDEKKRLLGDSKVLTGKDLKRKKKEVEKQVIATKLRSKEIAMENEQPRPYTVYSEQLKDARWKAFRWFVFKVRGEKCEVCGSNDKLQVHHIKYNPNCKAWEYSCKEVIVVCRDCHKKIHGKI